MSDPNASHSRSGLIDSLIREPVLHFLLIAAVLFGVYALFQARGEKLLEIDAREIEARLFLLEMSSGQALDVSQREALTRAYIEEQILVREALEMELDNDARIHDMLAQKMRHVLSGDIIQPGAARLQQYYEANIERYRTAARVSVQELVFDNRDDLPAEVLASLQAGADAERLLTMAAGSVAPLPDVSRQDLRNIFSADFAAEVFAAEVGQWQGPFVSNRGQHWLRITGRSPARLPQLSEIEDRVRLDWIAEEEEALLRREVARLWDQYTIRITGESRE